MLHCSKHSQALLIAQLLKMIGEKVGVFIGADHRGFKLAEELYLWLLDNRVSTKVVGAQKLDPDDDYVDYAKEVANVVANDIKLGRISRGIVLCGSGVGVDVVANKIKGIRCGLGISPAQVKEAREDDDINVLAIAADYTTEEQAKEMIKVFLETPFSNAERHKRRIEKIKRLE